MEEYIEQMLINSLDYGITENDFWEMTPAEVVRSVNSKIKIQKVKSQERASYDYIQAQLIIKGVGIMLGNKDTMPTLAQAYPTIFEDEAAMEAKQQQQTNLSTLRFLQFAQSHNAHFKERGGA